MRNVEFSFGFLMRFLRNNIKVCFVELQLFKWVGVIAYVWYCIHDFVRVGMFTGMQNFTSKEVWQLNELSISIFEECAFFCSDERIVNRMLNDTHWNDCIERISLLRQYKISYPHTSERIRYVWRFFRNRTFYLLLKW